MTKLTPARKTSQISHMVRLPASIISLTLCVTTAWGQSGTVMDDLSMTSEILGGQRKYAIYLPPDYDTSERTYPVLYLLHGRHDDHTSWIQFGELKRTVDQAIRKGDATPMIIVTPNASAGTDNYLNRLDVDWRYEDFFFEEFMPYIEKTYRIKPERQRRAITGQSMGGGGAFIYALHRPDLFLSAAPISPSFVTTPEAFRKYFEIPDTFAGPEFEAHWDRYSVLRLIESVPEDQKDTVRWFLDCGDDDYLSDESAMAHIAMKRKGIPHEYRVRDGAHNWDYFRQSFSEVLRFVSAGFHK